MPVPLAGARAELQGAAAAAPGEGPLHLRLPRLPAAAERGHHDLQGGRGAGGRGPGAARRADARGRAPLQPPLRPGLPRAEDAAHRERRACRAPTAARCRSPTATRSSSRTRRRWCAQKIKPMVTDPARKRRTDPGNPDICPVFDLHKAFSPTETQEWAAAGLPHRRHRLPRLQGPAHRPPAAAPGGDPRPAARSTRRGRTRCGTSCTTGSQRAREVARATMEEVRSAMKIAYPIR